MKSTKEGQKRVLMVLFLWLFLLMIAYLVLHTFYAFAALPSPPLLYFLPAFIYMLAAGLTGAWSLLSLRRHSMSLLLALILSMGLLSLGIVFGIQGLQHMYR